MSPSPHLLHPFWCYSPNALYEMDWRGVTILPLLLKAEHGPVLIKRSKVHCCGQRTRPAVLSRALQAFTSILISSPAVFLVFNFWDSWRCTPLCNILHAQEYGQIGEGQTFPEFWGLQRENLSGVALGQGWHIGITLKVRSRKVLFLKIQSTVDI